MEVLDAVLFFLPAGLANLTPVLANRVPLLNKWDTPMDFGKSVNGIRILGNNKRWRGLVCGTLFGAFSSLVIYLIAGKSYYTGDMVPIFPHVDALLGGFLLGFGALAGDALESFLKRQRGIKSGESWFPFDQIDYILGGIVCSIPLVGFDLRRTIIILVAFFGLHLLFSWIAFKLGLKDQPI